MSKSNIFTSLRRTRPGTLYQFENITWNRQTYFKCFPLAFLINVHLFSEDERWSHFCTTLGKLSANSCCCWHHRPLFRTAIFGSSCSLKAEIRKSRTSRLKRLLAQTFPDATFANAAPLNMVATASSAAADISTHVESVHPQFSASTEPVHNSVGVAVRLGSEGEPSTGNR